MLAGTSCRRSTASTAVIATPACEASSSRDQPLTLRSLTTLRASGANNSSFDQPVSIGETISVACDGVLDGAPARRKRTRVHEWMVSVDSVWEHDPVGRRIRRVSGPATPSAPIGRWRSYLALHAVVHSIDGTVEEVGELKQGREWMIVRRPDGKGSTIVTPLIATTTASPAHVWEVEDNGEIANASRGWFAYMPGGSGGEGMAGLLNIAEGLPDQEGTEWYWWAGHAKALYARAKDVPDAWVVLTRNTPLLFTNARSAADRVMRLLGRLPVAWYRDIVCAIVVPSGWPTGPAAIHLANDDLILDLILSGGWPPPEALAVDPETRRQWALQGRDIEAAGTPWPRVYDEWKASRNSSP